MGYENWSFKRAYTKKQPQVAADKDSTKSSTSNKTFVVAPYVQGVSEKVRRVFSSYGVSICFKPYQTLRQILVAPKDGTKVEDQTGVVYHIPCGGCNKVYVGETKRSVGERIEEHTTKPIIIIFIHKEIQPKLNKDCGRDFPKIHSCLLATKTTAGTSATKQEEKACSL